MTPYKTNHNGKYCAKCGKTLPLEKFNRNKWNCGGYSGYCSFHEAERMREYRKHRDKEAYNAYMREWMHKKRKQQKGEPMPEKAEQVEMFKKPEPVARPLTGPTCKTCGKVLYSYDIKRGECFTHIQERNHAWHNEPVRHTAAIAADGTD